MHVAEDVVRPQLGAEREGASLDPTAGIAARPGCGHYAEIVAKDVHRRQAHDLVILQHLEGRVRHDVGFGASQKVGEAIAVEVDPPPIAQSDA